MTSPLQFAQPSTNRTTNETKNRTTSKLIREFLQFSEGQWRSQRRYYTLPEGPIQEMVTLLTVQFLEPGSEELLELGSLHQLSAEESQQLCGSKVSWDSSDSVSQRKKSSGSTVFGALGNILYRDRGFATPNPVKARCYLPNPETLCLRTEYNGSAFEEEIKHIGQQYRTRQSIMSRANEQIMIGQYLEKRVK